MRQSEIPIKLVWIFLMQGSINQLKFQRAGDKLMPRVFILNHFHFSVSFGTILLRWNSRDLLTRIEWSENDYADLQSGSIPSSLSGWVDRIQKFFDQGEPLGSTPWDLIDQAGWTPFQKNVYQLIAKIPYGESRTYGWVASRLGNPKASRAVGQALRKNPVPILIPCHRITSANSMGGFMGVIDPARPELQLKQKLMLLEEEYRSPLFSFLAPGWSSSRWPMATQKSL